MRNYLEMSQEERTAEINYQVDENKFYNKMVIKYKEALDCLKNLDLGYFNNIVSQGLPIVYENGDWDVKNGYSNGIEISNQYSFHDSAIERLEFMIECGEQTADYAIQKVNEIMYVTREYIDL